MERSNSISRTCILLYFVVVTFEIKISMKFPEKSQHTRYLPICLLYFTSFHEVHAFFSMFLPLDPNILELTAPTTNNCMKSYRIYISIRSNFIVFLIQPILNPQQEVKSCNLATMIDTQTINFLHIWYRTVSPEENKKQTLIWRALL